jgi:ATP-dependent helicase HrpB
VEAVVGEVVAALRDVGTAVLVAPPGAGKTTVVPLHLQADPVLGVGRIVVLEPRRLAARAAARRMADLLGEPVGRRVGYRTRDERVGGRDVRIEVITEGILVRRIQADPTLAGTSVVVLDEVHERNLVTDLSLALLVDVRRSLRPDLAVLAMSATVDADRVASILGTGADGAGGAGGAGGRTGAPVVTSDGRQHPVDVGWWPPGPRDREADHVARSVLRALDEDRHGDVLVFLPGAGEIGRVARLLAPGVPPTVDVFPLHGSLPSADQDRALAPSAPGRRRVVLATDIAESSLTVDGVRLVVDAGLARSPRVDPGTGLTRLVTRPASQAAADQRAGRAGRLGPGVARRLWPAADHRLRPRFADPEIAVVDLAGLALELAVWGSDPADLAFPDQPPARAWTEARTVLVALGALDDRGRPTATGRAMADLPLHPRLARLVVEGHRRGEGWLAAVVAAVLDERDVLVGRRDDRTADLAERVLLVALGSPVVDGGPVRGDGPAVAVVRRRAGDLARRVGARRGPVDPTAIGPLVALAHPDRIAQARGGGRFRLRDGGGGWLPVTDPLATAPFLAVAAVDVADGVDADRGVDGRIRLATPLDRADVEALVAGHVETVVEVAWDRDRDDLRSHTERRAGSLVLGSRDGAPEPGPAVTRALLERVRTTGGAVLGWTDTAQAFRHRVALLRRYDDGWPDLGDGVLVTAEALNRWLAPHLVGAAGRRDLEGLDLVAVLRGGLDHQRLRDLDRLAPRTVSLASGRSVTVDYTGETPAIATRVQDLYGTTVHPTVVEGRVPLVVHLLSPAGRPVQVTADLPGFWAGSWREVRKELAGRYPKHRWPLDPSTDESERGGGRYPR